MKKEIKTWIDNNISSNLANKNVFITGANSGIGFELAKYCAYLKANIFLLCRNLDKANIAKDKILNEYPNTNITIIELDQASFSSIKKCANEVKKYDVDYFINNAGVFRLPKDVTSDGLDITMGTNFIGTKYLNDMLNEYFITLNHPVTNIFTSSIASRLYKINHNDFFLDKHYSPFKIYGLSKRAINDLYYYYIDKYNNSNIRFGLTHPGATYTPIITKAYKNKWFENQAHHFLNVFCHYVDKAALSDLYAINANKNVIVGPRNFFEFKGYPKITSFKKNKDYLKTIEIADNIINRKKETNY